jgi:iron complex outermembrane receptor protein
MIRVPAVAALLALAAGPALAQTPPPSGPIVELPAVQVVAPTRLPGDPLPSSSVPAFVDVISGSELRASGALTVQEVLRALPGVTLNDEQGNAVQPTVSFRGFQATSVTGVPQGISVFVDGVRVNEPTVEEINFDLLPLDDVERIEIIRGPTAAFGRNTLGGAVNIITRRGTPVREIEADAEGGSFGRQRYRARLGGAEGPLDYYVSGTLFKEDGWRDVSESRIGKVFGKIGLQRAGTDLTLSYQHAENRIEQPGSLPLSELRRDRTQNFTGGDFFKPVLNFGTVNLGQELSEHVALAANAFVRGLTVEQFNANLVAENTRSFFDTVTAGGTLQLTHQAELFGRKNRLVGGVEFVHSDVKVRVLEEGDDGVELDSKLRDESHAFGVYLEDTFDLANGLLLTGDRLVLTAGVRYDWLRHDIRDRVLRRRPSASQVSTFDQASPRIGLNYNPTPALGFYSVYGEGFRAPSFLELTCASPAAVCPGLQAGVAPDPPIDPVRVRHYEIGMRSRPLPWLQADVALFRTDVIDDIFPVSPTGTVGLFFQNVGETRRQGAEIGLRAAIRRVADVYVNYAYTEATFQDDVALGTPRQTAGCTTALCTQLVRKGDDLPLIPNHRLNAGVDVHLTSWLTLSLGGRYVGTQRVRGDEENVERKLADYVVVSAGLRATVHDLTAHVWIDNAFDERYETFGTFAPNGRRPGAPIERFLTPAPPINVLGGLSYRF